MYCYCAATINENDKSIQENNKLQIAHDKTLSMYINI